jgi:hypothetical protein
MMTVPNIVIGGILSIAIFSSSSTEWRIVKGVLAISSTILTSLSKHVCAGEKSQLHCNVVRQYMALIQELNIFLHTSNNNTHEANIKFVDHMREQLNKLYDLQPKANSIVVARFEKKYKKSMEEALYSEFEDLVMKNATYAEHRLSRFKQKPSTETEGSP